ncbi:MAG: domain S-box [Phycisphaerales bacterium]|nr:domain S-box [Phycisphaerales bacterium]
MGLPLRALIVEDSADDAALLLNHLKRGGYDTAWTRVETAPDLMTALASQAWDLIIADHSLPQFSGLAALRIMKEQGLDLPFILVSGAAGEELAVDAMKAGAHDYLTKGNLTRLLPAIDRELREAKERQARNQAEAAIHKSEERFRLLVEGVKDYAIYMLDPEGRIVSWNFGAERITGYSTQEVLGQDFSRFYTNEENEKGQARIDLDLAGKSGRFEDEGWRVRKDGSRFWAALVITAMRDASGTLLGFAKVTQDITERKQTEEQLRKSDERFKHIARATNDAVWDWDLASNSVWWNEGFQTLFGYRGDQIDADADSWFKRLHPDDLDRVNKGLHAVLDGGGSMWSDEYRFRRSDESYAYILNRGYVIRDNQGRPIRMIGAMMDITERKQGEEAVWRARAELAERVAQRTSELAEANEALRLEVAERKRAEIDSERAKAVAEAASQSKSEFLAKMSHEIRTPMNGVIGMTDLLLGTDLSAQQRRHAEIIKSSGEALLTLINDILDFSKIEAGKLELNCADFDPRECLEEVVQMLAQRGSSKGLEIACHIDEGVPARVRGDADRLRQILINLIGNAIKFTDRGEVITRVQMQDASDDALTLRFSIRDTGPGIMPEGMGRLFKSFSQVDSTATRRHGGTGLGLAISKQLAELMGGTIGAESQPGSGSTFWFTLRVHNVPAPSVERTSPVDLRQLRVLAVDDNASCREILADQLGAWGCDVAAEADGAGALKTLIRSAQSRPFNLALLDQDMPGINGVELAKTVRARPELEGTILLLVSPVEGGLDPAALESAGFAGQISKPVRQSQLFDVIMNAVCGSKVQASNATQEPRNIAVIPPAMARLRILVAEDNKVNQMVVAEILARAGHACDIVETGTRAVEEMMRKQYDLVLMDCQMPEMDGFEATRSIREWETANPQRQPIPIVALTANAIKGDRERCLEAGMNGYLSKPIDSKKLVAAIHTFAASGARSNDQTETATSVQTSVGGAIDQNDTVAPFDMKTLLDRCMGNANIVGKILEEFEKQIAGDVRHIEMLVESADAARVGQVAHGLKGAAGIISAEALQQVASQIEQRARTLDWEGIRDSLTPLREEAERCLAHLPTSKRELAAFESLTVKGKS